MTIRKQFILVLALVSVLSVALNAAILAYLTNTYFSGYLAENYENHLSQIQDYVKAALSDDDVSYRQMIMELETHVVDPILQIKLYHENGDLLAVAGRDMPRMMDRHMMDDMRSPEQDEVVQYVIKKDQQTLGILNITRRSTSEKTLVAQMFTMSLLRNSLLSIVLAGFLAVLVGIIISQKMSRAMKETAEFAENIQFGHDAQIQNTTLKEVNIIRKSLNELHTRLKLKQKSRTALIDEMVHQTRTPLTILKSHLEGLEDGVIALTTEEIAICQNQIDHVTDIITNMSAMIDADKELKTVSNEEFDFSRLVVQIISGLKSQFLKKNIRLELTTQQKLIIQTDRYKLSQVIYNVLTNAFKYTNPDGLVEVCYKEEDATLVLRVLDNGIGIHPDELEKIFDAYYRSAAASKTDGEGIGLYVARENMRLLNGQITASSELGVGSTFTIQVPLRIS